MYASALEIIINESHSKRNDKAVNVLWVMPACKPDKFKSEKYLLFPFLQQGLAFFIAYSW